TAAQDVRETAECRLEAFKLRPGLTETDLEVQAAFMDICMEARGYVFLPSCTPNAGGTYNLGYKFNSLFWRKNLGWRWPHSNLANSRLPRLAIAVVPPSAWLPSTWD